MPRIAYEESNLKPATIALIARSNQIIAQYQAQGFQLTLRQLYYQHVARGFIPNNDREYKRLGEAISNGRLGGLVDWNAIIDRTRNLQGVQHYDSPTDIIDVAARAYRIDKWEGQEYRPEVWVEKDALVGVLETVCQELDVSYFACRGYTSQSEMWAAAMRLRRYRDAGQTPVIIHLGDHDPSGIDMTRDVFDRLRLFLRGREVAVERIALNYDQVTRYNPPPNPAKLTDSRVGPYIARYGDESWELDALDPVVIATLIREKVLEYRDEDLWEEKVAEEETDRQLLARVSTKWDDISDRYDADTDDETTS